MKILTLNTWQESGPWQKRWDVILDGLRAYQADIVGFQETFNGVWFEKIREKSGYPYGVYMHDKCGQSFLSKFPIKQTELYTMKTQAKTEDYQRFAIYAELEVEQGSPIHVFNTHLAWKTEEAETRADQVEELIEFIDEKAGAREAVAVGDFNAHADTQAIRKMMTLGKFNDAWAVLHPKDIGLTWDNRNPYAAGGTVMPDRRLDYVFVRNNSKHLAHLETVEIVFTKPSAEKIYASDHFGVLTTFRGKG